MGVIESIRIRLRGETFRPTLLSAIIGSSFISRRGLYNAISKLAPSITGSVLDFGCGSKPYEFLFTKSDSYTGVDLEQTGHDHVDSKVDVFYDGNTLPFPNDHFDAVVSFEVFEHVFNLQDVLLEIRRVTKDSGYLLISTPFSWSEHEVPYDFARYTTFGISHVLQNSGYQIVSVTRTTTYLLTVCQMFMDYLAQLGPRSWTRPFLQLFVIFPGTLAAYAFNAILPKRYNYFCNTVVLAKKSSETPDS